MWCDSYREFMVRKNDESSLRQFAWIESCYLTMSPLRESSLPFAKHPQPLDASIWDDDHLDMSVHFS